MGARGLPTGRPGTASYGTVRLAPPGVRRTEEMVVREKDSLSYKILPAAFAVILLEMAAQLPHKPLKQWLCVLLVQCKMQFLIFLLTLSRCFLFFSFLLSTLGLEVF